MNLFILALCVLFARVSAKQIHVVFGNHLDIGFDNIEPYVGYDNDVLNMYFNRYLPLAVDISDYMARVSPHKDKYVYTTHSYVISLFLECPTNMGLDCPSAATKSKVLRGIQTGAITWHAHPHNAQYELYDPSLLDFSFQLTHNLDKRFGFAPKRTAILRDVPGLTRAAIPILVRNGIKAISVGVNGGSAPPGVPHYTPFIWRDEASNTEILAFWHPGGYGGLRPGNVFIDPPEQCIQARGLDHVLCTAWRNDNEGPPLTVLEPLRVYQLLRQEWPLAVANSFSSSSSRPGSSSSSSQRAPCSTRSSSSSTSRKHNPLYEQISNSLLASSNVFASSFDAFVDAVLDAVSSKCLKLPVATSEIGDTWVFGVQSDPYKTANFRAVSRARAACVLDPHCPSEGASFFEFSRLLLKVPEHTWGVDIKKTLHDFANYSNTDFHKCIQPRTRNPKHQQQQQQHNVLQQTSALLAAASLSSIDSNAAAAAAAAGPANVYGGSSSSSSDDGVPLREFPCINYQHCIHSWDRQAAYIDWAIKALPPDHPVVQAYSADVTARTQLTDVTHDQLVAAGAGVSDTAAAAASAAAAGKLEHEGADDRSSSSSSEESGSSAEVIGSTRFQQGLSVSAQILADSKWRSVLFESPRFQQQAALGPMIRQQQQQQNTWQQQQQQNSWQQQQQQNTWQQQQQQNTWQQQQQQNTWQQQQQQNTWQQQQQKKKMKKGRRSSQQRQYTCGSWQFTLDETQGGLTSLKKLYGPDRSQPGTDWAQGSKTTTTTTHSSSSSSSRGGSNSGSRRMTPDRSTASDPRLQDGCKISNLTTAAAAAMGGGVLGQSRYSAYCESSYDFVWKYYAYQQPLSWWFPLDFGKVNSSTAWNKEVHVTADLQQVYESFTPTGDLQQLTLRSTFPSELVEKVGAPSVMWTIITCPGANSSSSSGSSNSATPNPTSNRSSSGSRNSATPNPSSSSSSVDLAGAKNASNNDGDLQIAVVWQNKTPARLPEALWFSFVPDPEAIDVDSWRMHKLGSWIRPQEVILNGSQSMHAVSESGIQVESADRSEGLQITTLDTALVSPGHPNPFPNGAFAPCMQEGMHFNLMNNIWGTNYVMWVPYRVEDVNMAFRFSVHAERRQQQHQQQLPKRRDQQQHTVAQQ